MPQDVSNKSTEANTPNDVEVKNDQAAPKAASDKPDKTASDKQEAKDQQDSQVNTDRVVEKLQHRLGKEQADKNEYKQKLEKMQAELEKLKQGKSVKDINQEDQNRKALADKDKQIQKLQAQIKHSQTVKEVDGIFKDADLNVGDDVLNLVVSNDNEQTVSNAKAIIALINRARDEGRQGILRGQTPKVGAKKIHQSKRFNQLSLVERAQLKKQDPERFQKLMRSNGFI